jgi:hypothetical protein
MDVKDRLKTMFKNWLAPLVNLEYTLLLFATFIFHHHYFGAGHAVADFLAFDETLLMAVYSYGAVVLLASLVTISPDWRGLVALMVFIGSAFISVAYTSLFWMHPATPSWQELLAQLYYVLQEVVSLVLVILLLTQEPGKRLYVNPRLGGVPTPLKTLAILTYVVGITLLLDRGFSVDPDQVTDRATLYGAVLLEVLARVTHFLAGRGGGCGRRRADGKGRPHDIALSRGELPSRMRRGEGGDDGLVHAHHHLVAVLP